MSFHAEELMSKQHQAHFERAVRIIGGSTATARLLGLYPSAVSNMIARGKPIDASYCPLIEQATGRRVKCEELRPDVRWDVLRGSAE